MKLTTLFTVLAAALPALAADTGSYTVSGLGARKSALTAAGGNTLDMAIAMLETETMTTDYTYGDGKSGDAANFGLFKQNWFMLRNACSMFSGKTAADSDSGAVLNSDITSDVNCRHESEAHYGSSWWAGHRNGEAGLNGEGLDDVEVYKSAVLWIQQQIESNSAYLTDDTRFYNYVKPIKK
ncbi:hypothetical protein EDC01DRAFT_620105 [Geopyxis carbonaria]|nr:hypothetical protein EDC01DRAFT_620105 [Geopyxis carbonaria]